MKKLFLGSMLLALAISVPVSTIAGVKVSIGFPLPPPIVVATPPEVVVLPNTGVYAAPDLAVDLFFFDGWWWRPWEGRWYRSRSYHSGWAYYDGVPYFHGGVPSGWRDDYRAHRWHGQDWHYQRVSHPQLQQMYHYRDYRDRSRPQYRMNPQQSRPQHFQANKPYPQGKTLHREVGRSSQQVRPVQYQRPAPQQSRSPHGGYEGRR